MNVAFLFRKKSSSRVVISSVTAVFNHSDERQIMFNGLDDSQAVVSDAQEDSEIEIQIEQLVKAQEAGNEEEVARLQARLSGVKVECAVS